MRAELGLPSVKGDDEHGGGMTGGFGGSMGGAQGGKGKRPINVKFEIPYFTTSGIQVRYLKIIEPKVSFYGLPSSFPPFLLDPISRRSAAWPACRLCRFASAAGTPRYYQCAMARSMLRLACPPADELFRATAGVLSSDSSASKLTIGTLQLQYPSLPWVRYITQSGDIAVRLPDVH